MFPIEGEGVGFRADNGELGWTREQIPMVVDTLVHRGLGILGGELWWVREGVSGWTGLIPQREGPPAVYSWTTEWRPGERWQEFVSSSAAVALEKVRQWPHPGDVSPDLPGRILYNLTCLSETEYEELRNR